MAAGGIPRGAFTMLNVCDPSRLSTKKVGEILGDALTNLNLSLDPPTIDNYAGLGLGTRWSTTAAPVGRRELDQYNDANSERLPSDIKLYYHFESSSINMGENLLSLYTATVVEVGTSFERREAYKNTFNSAFFHNKLKSSLEEGLVKYGCSK
jgi:hypothetical protein